MPTQPSPQAPHQPPRRLVCTGRSRTKSARTPLPRARPSWEPWEQAAGALRGRRTWPVQPASLTGARGWGACSPPSVLPPPDLLSSSKDHSTLRQWPVLPPQRARSRFRCPCAKDCGLRLTPGQREVPSELAPRGTGMRAGTQQSACPLSALAPVALPCPLDLQHSLPGATQLRGLWSG